MRRLILAGLTAFALVGCHHSPPEAFPCAAHHRIATVQNYGSGVYLYQCQDGTAETWQNGVLQG